MVYFLLSYFLYLHFQSKVVCCAFMTIQNPLGDIDGVEIGFMVSFPYQDDFPEVVSQVSTVVLLLMMQYPLKATAKIIVSYLKIPINCTRRC